jgi:hypothetical protein
MATQQEYSNALRKEARQHNVPVQQLIMADLMSIGYNKSDAYFIAYNPRTYTSQAIKTQRDAIAETDAFDDLVQQRTASHRDISVKTEEVEMITDVEVAKDILTSARKQPVGSKDRADLMAKYYDITKKIGMASDGQEIVHVWLPLTCHICPFYKKNAKKE